MIMVMYSDLERLPGIYGIWKINCTLIKNPLCLLKYGSKYTVDMHYVL